MCIKLNNWELADVKLANGSRTKVIVGIPENGDTPVVVHDYIVDQTNKALVTSRVSGQKFLLNKISRAYLKKVKEEALEGSSL